MKILALFLTIAGLGLCALVLGGLSHNPHHGALGFSAVCVGVGIYAVETVGGLG